MAEILRGETNFGKIMINKRRQTSANLGTNEYDGGDSGQQGRTNFGRNWIQKWLIK
jgi:hypothetical protein